MRKIKEKKKNFQVTNSHWCEIYRAFGKNNFRSKYYYLTNWTEKSTVLSIEKGKKRTSGLTLGNERGEKN